MAATTAVSKAPKEDCLVGDTSGVRCQFLSANKDIAVCLEATNFKDSHNAVNRRSSLSIIQPKTCLDDMVRYARKIRLQAGASASEIPLPTIMMKFKVIPASALPPTRAIDQETGLTDTASRKFEDQIKNNSQISGMEAMNILAELDLGVLLQRWLTKLLEPGSPNEVMAKRESLRRVSRIRSMGSFTTHKEESQTFLEALSKAQAPAGAMLMGGRERQSSDKLRPWAASFGSTSSPKGQDYVDLHSARSSADTLPNLLRQASDGTVDLCVQSVDLLSTDSSVSDPLTN